MNHLQDIDEMNRIDESREMIYLAGPYTPVLFGCCLERFPFKTIGRLITWYRWKRLSRAAANLIKAGYFVFSPISYSHVVPLDRLDAVMWLEQDFWFVKRADRIFVLDLWGWPGSHGVSTELGWGNFLKKPMYLIDIKGKIQKRLNSEV